MASTRTRPLRVDSAEMDRHPLNDATGAGDPAETGRAGQVRAPRQAIGPLNTLDWRQAVGGGLIGLGMLGIVVAWFGVSGTLDPGKQMPYISSGGFGGSALIAIGVTLLVSFEHIRDREALRDVLDDLDDVRAQLDALHQRVSPSDNGA